MRSYRLMIGAVVAGLLVVPPGARAATTPSRSPASQAARRAVTASPVLPWIEDDYSRAVAEAKARKIPIFVESWAPW